jgi:hypothetical protein
MKISHGLIASLFLVGLSVMGASAASAQGVHLHANLVGGNEPAGGDPNGFGTAAIQFRSSTEICVAIVVAKIKKPIGAHLHQGFPPENGPIVVPLTTPSKGDPGESFTCATIEAELAARIKKNPSNFYVNVHTSDFQGGAIRGQLF